jgi:hypothetical protein
VVACRPDPFEPYWAGAGAGVGVGVGRGPGDGIPGTAPFAGPRPVPTACSSAGVITGGLSEGARRPKPAYVLCGGRLATGAKIRARSSLPSVSFSISSSTRSSSTSRYSFRISQASSCAISMICRTSESMSVATVSE